MKEPIFSPRVETAIGIAREAGAVLRRWYDADPLNDAIHFKGPTDLQTAADRDSESHIVRAIAHAFPGESVFAEESGGACAPGMPCWYIDPLDGTTNFAHRDPMFAVSLGCAHDDELLAGVVYQPTTDELYIAERGRGAWVASGRTWKRLSVSHIDDIGRALVATGTPIDIGTAQRNVPEILAMLRATRDIRIHGSAALNLAYVAAGRLEAFWEPGLHEWDVAAGVLLVLEAGGRVSGLRGGRFRLGEDVLATNASLHDDIARILARARVRP